MQKRYQEACECDKVGQTEGRYDDEFMAHVDSTLVRDIMNN